MNKFHIYNLFVFVICVFLFNTVSADNLGRIFTTANERQKLEKVRLKKDEPVKVEVKVEEITLPEDTVVNKEVIIRDAITLKGLVHREGGKSVAWINDSNTFEGNLDLEYIDVPKNKIKPDEVTVVMPDDSTQVELKVGEVFIPKPIEKDVIEIIDEVDNDT